MKEDTKKAIEPFMNLITVTRRFDFCYAHTLPEYEGKCVQMHGHNGVLEIEVSHEVPDYFKRYNGMVMDFGLLKKVVNDTIIDKIDHKYLNEVYEFDEDVPPTAENTVAVIAFILEAIFGAGLVRVRLYETPNSYAEWRRW